MRKDKVRRKTAETEISVELRLDSKPSYKVSTTIRFMDHMLELMMKHGQLGGSIIAEGDTDIDDHHTVEDLGITLGKALRGALGPMHGIRRYGFASVPMDEALANVSLDISGRPYLVYNVPLNKRSRVRDFELDLVQHFLESFAAHAGVTLHVNVPYGRNNHHMVEAVFKALGRALHDAVSIEPGVKGVPSTKGML